MKTRLLVISMMLVVGTALTGCATSRELEKVQAQQNLINAKADQAVQDAQAAKTDAAAAKLKADDAVKAAEARETMVLRENKTTTPVATRSVTKLTRCAFTKPSSQPHVFRTFRNRDHAQPSGRVLLAHLRVGERRDPRRNPVIA
jgi:murein lipoprotein